MFTLPKPAFLVIIFLTSASFTSAAAAATDPAVATINGTPMTLSELQQKSADRLFQAKNTYYEAEKKVINEYIDDYLLKKQAEKENLTVEELLERHVTAALPKDPTEEALRLYYEGIETKEPFDAVREKILEHIRQQRREKARAAYVQSIRNGAEVAVTLPPPRAEVDLGEAPVMGPSHAPVTVVEFADYECPYCQQVDPELKRIGKEYAGRVAIAFKDTPLPMHSHAEKAAEAARCAGVQNKFWDYHDALFANKQLEIADLKQTARKLNLDGTEFDKCLDSGQQAPVVKQDLEQAQKLGISGTPSFFINGRFVSGAVTYEALKEVIEGELSTAERAGSPATISMNRTK